jgi:hypothetical protein
VALLQTEAEVKSKRHRIDEQNRLYELTVRQTMPQLERIKARLAEAEQAGAPRKKQLLREINILGTYIKRRSNLILMDEGKEAASLSELSRCFEESFESLGQDCSDCFLTITALGEVNHDSAVLLYDFFQAVVEAGLPAPQNLHITLSEQENALLLSIEIKGGENLAHLPDAAWRKEEVAALGGQILCRSDGGGDKLSLALSLPRGGAAG